MKNSRGFLLKAATMKLAFKQRLIIAFMLGRFISPCEAAALWDDFGHPCLTPCLACAETTAAYSQSQREVIERCERALQQDPEDDQALEQLHTIVAKADGLSREESLRLRQVIRQYARRAQTVLAPRGEPGEPMIVSGAVRDEAGKPVAGALIYVFHADAKGHYAPDRVMDEPNARLFGYMKTGADGRYEFRTIRPGGYPLQPIPQHIHMLVTAAGYRDHACRSTCQLVFDDDPRMTPAWHQWAKDGGNPVLHVRRDQNGVQRCGYDIVLQKK
jgi:protocatechuate 3,4-dioxygenase beta subunit